MVYPGVSRLVLAAVLCLSLLLCVSANPLDSFPKGVIGDTVTCTWTSMDILNCNGTHFKEEALDVPGSREFYIHMTVCIFCVLFAGIMSGLTIGLLSFDVTTLQVLKEGGEPKERVYAAALIPLIEKKHWLLVTLLLCNAAAMETLPIFLDRMMPSVYAIIVSVTAVLFFGEIIPQAICSKFGLAIGYYFSWPVQLLMIILSPLSWTVGALLDVLLGEEEGNYFRRDELKVLVDLHTSNEEEPLSEDEITIIRGVLDMANKNVMSAMQPIDTVYSISHDDKLDEAKVKEIYSVGHSRVPVYRNGGLDIAGCLLMKQLAVLDPEDATPVSSLSLKPLCAVSQHYPLYNLMNDFLSGQSGHMALVYSEEVIGKMGSVIGIITLEDIIEEMIAKEIYDESDVINTSYRESVAHLRQRCASIPKAGTHVTRSALRKIITRPHNMININKNARSTSSLIPPGTSHENTPLLPPPNNNKNIV
eukprot:CFRG7661T1